MHLGRNPGRSGTAVMYKADHLAMLTVIGLIIVLTTFMFVAG